MRKKDKIQLVGQKIFKINNLTCDFSLFYVVNKCIKFDNNFNTTRFYFCLFEQNRI